MANALRGEVSFEADGQTWTLRYSQDALCELEGALDKSIIEICADFESWKTDPRKMRMAPVRALLWAGLREHHPDLSLKEAGELMAPAGGIAKVLEMTTRAMTLAWPQAETKGARPPNRASRRKAAAQVGTI